MLAETGKAAVIHPTGTGKSFIGFRLCEDNPDKSICWLSPSEYIFRTQLENLIEAAGGYQPGNIQFFTYAKLMLLTSEELETINPDIIVLDEFHRCGAQMWGKGVQNLLELFPEVPILGLSATNIRYLDNQQDMADELFDGNIASEMTLGEAIVRGILSAPKYVVSVYSYQKELERLSHRVRHAKNRAVRDAADGYLDALRRALEQANGLDVIFYRHMTDRTGKYIVFTADYDAMRACMAKVPEWFGGVDQEPHVYSVYSEDPTADASFRAFKADDDSSHLRLLFCIDALNEGIHVENVAGVILFRPTVSPIIYKQQVGRALSASKRAGTPVIFDIVNNFENLYSIGSIQEEMRAAVTYYNFFGKDGTVVTDRFQIIDEVRDCRKLFDELEETLTASWDLMFGCAKAYYVEHGHLEVPRRYKTAEGYALGQWIFTQRKVRAGEQYGNLDERRVALLDSVGMVWSSMRDISWERYYAAAERYSEEHGNLNVKAQYVTMDGLMLGSWISNLRTARKSGNRSIYLTPERITALDRLGMIWDQPDYLFERNYAAALEYFRQHGDLEAPISCVINGVKLGLWLNALRTTVYGKKNSEKLTLEQKARLDELGMRWETGADSRWEAGFSEARKYLEGNGNMNVPCSYVSPSGYKLGAWIVHQRDAYRTGRIKPERRARLDDIGMLWSNSRANGWDECYDHLKRYRDETGGIDLPVDYVVDGIWLAKWLNEQKQIYHGRRKGKALSEDQVRRLEDLGMTWRSSAEDAWLRRYEAVKRFYDLHGNIDIPKDEVLSDGRKIGSWVNVQRRYRNAGKLADWQIRLLDEVGMVWKLDDPFEVGFSHAEEYAKAHGNLDIAGSYVCEDGYNLGGWIRNCRAQYRTPLRYHVLTQEQTERLSKLGMVWAPREEQWERAYQKACDYYRKHRDLNVSGKYVDESGFSLGEWLRSQHRKYERGNMPEEMQVKLESIGMTFEPPRREGPLVIYHKKSCAGTV